MKPDPFEMLRAYTSGTEMQQELIAARATIAALRKELADAKENYHVTNSIAAKLKAENERLRKAGEAIVKDNLNWLTDKKHIAEWNAAKEGKPSV